MDETSVNWWMDHTSRWHRGFPPASWWQAEDGRWHPPGHDDDPTEEVREVPSAGGAHLADGWGWPLWARIAVLASVALVAIVVVAAAAITDGGGDGDGETVTADVSTTIAPSTTAPAPTPPGSVSSVGSPPAGDGTDPPATPTTVRAPTTTTATTQAPPGPAPTSPPPSDPGVHQGEPCSPEGATAVTSDGVPMTCTTQKCHGAPFDSARWRRTAC
jgi:hypothetical protein